MCLKLNCCTLQTQLLDLSDAPRSTPNFCALCAFFFFFKHMFYSKSVRVCVSWQLVRVCVCDCLRACASCFSKHLEASSLFSLSLNPCV